jgi:predicted nucleic acid-binding protein
MIATELLDTNILVYAYDPTDPRKQQIARELVRKGLDGACLVSTQTLAEFAAVLLHKKSPPADAAAVKKALDALSPIAVIAPDWSMVRRAVEARAAYGLHFYDGMMVAAAERAGCSRIWSEDLNPGQAYFGVRVENPFASRSTLP